MTVSLSCGAGVCWASDRVQGVLQADISVPATPTEGPALRVRVY